MILEKAGPFGIGETKACLDDLQASLLNYYGRLYRIEPQAPLDWQIEQLQRSYYPSPAPISGNVDSNGFLQGVDLADLAGALPKPFPHGLSTMKGTTILPASFNDDQPRGTWMRGDPPDRRDEAKARVPKVENDKHEREDVAALKLRREKASPAEARERGGLEKRDDHKPRKDKHADGRTERSGYEVKKKNLSFAVNDVINDLFEVVENDSGRIDKLQRRVVREVGDPTSLYFWRGQALPRGMRTPIYQSNRYAANHLNELEEHTETMYRNLKVKTEWNRKKIRLLQDRMKIITGDAGFRGEPRSAF